MTPRTRARACTAAAVLALACAITTADWQTTLAAPGLAAAILLWSAGRHYQHAHQAGQAAERLARPFPDPAPIPVADPEWDAIIRAYYAPDYDPRSST